MLYTFVCLKTTILIAFYSNNIIGFYVLLASLLINGTIQQGLFHFISGNVVKLPSGKSSITKLENDGPHKFRECEEFFYTINTIF